MRRSSWWVVAAGALAGAACGGGGAVPAPLPFADAGPDAVVRVSQPVLLDGRGSQDPSGAAFTFAWRLVSMPSGSAAALSNPTLPSPTFVPDLAGAYDLELSFVGSDGQTAVDHVTVVVIDDGSITPRRPPAAEPRAGGLARVGFLDVPPDSLSAPSPALVLADGALRTVTIVDLASDPADDPAAAAIAGMHRVDLVVGVGEHARLYAAAVAGDEDPVAVRFGDGTETRVVTYGVAGESFILDGTRSHDDGVVRTFTWTQVRGPFRFTTEDSLLSVVPTAPGTYVFELGVTDDIGLSSFSRRVVIPVLPAGTIGVGPPLASINGFLPEIDDEVLVLLDRGPRQTVSLDGSFSHARGAGGSLRFSWEQLSGPKVALAGADAPQASFVPLMSAAYEFELTVSDSNGVSDAARVFVFVVTPGGASAVAVVAGVPDPVLAGPGSPPLVVALDGSASTGEGVLEFRWTQLRGPPCVVDPSSAPSLGLVTIEQAGAYEFALRVFDGIAHSAPALVSFVVR